MLKMIFKEALISISSYKLRTILTMLGVTIGVAAVVAMVAVGEAIQYKIDSTFDTLGSNLIIIGPAETVKGGVRGARGRPTVTFDEVERLRKIPDVLRTTYLVNTVAQAVYGNNNYGVTVLGTTVDYAPIANWEVERGRWFTSQEQKVGRACVLIGQTLVDELFKAQNPVGKDLRLNGVSFTVIGTLKAKGDGSSGYDQDNLVVMPALTLRQRLKNSSRPKYADVVLVEAVAEDRIEQAAAKVETRLRLYHRIKENQDNDFTIKLMSEMLDKVREVGFYLALFLVAIASISLIVGSIGIMNMMLVAVTERTKEIGIRKSLGAPNSWIMTQFLIEAILISSIGSLIGWMLGFILSQIVRLVFDLVMPISILPAICAINVAILVGIISGIYPARKAMLLDPIEALHFA